MTFIYDIILLIVNHVRKNGVLKQNSAIVYICPRLAPLVDIITRVCPFYRVPQHGSFIVQEASIRARAHTHTHTSESTNVKLQNVQHEK